MRLAGNVLGILLIGVTAPVFGQVVVTNAPPLAYGSIGVTYSTQLTATPVGQPYQWTIIQGNLPAGLNLNAQTGEIAGVPTAGGTQTFTVRATAQNQQSGTKQLSIGILQISTPSPLPGATLGTFYSTPFNTSDGPASAVYTWQAGQAPPPPGLTVSTNGVLSGTPTATGTFNFQVFVFDEKDSIQAIKNFSIAVAASLIITTPSPLPNGDAGSPYKATLNATGGTAPYHWNILSGLPLGLNLDPNAGIISGTLLNPGQFSFSVQVIDSANSAGSKT
ncbi:MAG TPA: Ig domain-containing protein, partial [Bryobacteraceae bacterium]